MSDTQINGTVSQSVAEKAARRKRFEDVFPIIAEELLGYMKGECMPKDAVDWYRKVDTSFLRFRLAWSAQRDRVRLDRQ